MCYIGPRGRQGGIPENISRMAEEYQKSIKPPYDKDDIISAFECGYMKAQSLSPLTTNKQNLEI